MKWYLEAFKKYALFQGRARRKEYWMFNLINLIILTILVIIEQVVDISFLTGLYILAILLPCFSITARRLHDIGRSGWWILINYVPFGSIVLLVFTCQDSQEGNNEYGFNPKVPA
ncbi:DUF805 domain-containing protein [Metabacillus fastidiosus]|uniref:DUF805 domain-containing protein n=1 Tax=Metabacillus fastidiosus TaxID=1458 RepID=UPI003D2C7D8B